MSEEKLSDSSVDEIDLKELIGILWSNRIKILKITMVFAALSVILALSIPNKYTAATILAPAQQDTGGLSGALGQLGGLASIAGVRIGAAELTESQVAQEIMKSWSFVEKFIKDNDLAVEVYAAEGWSPKSNILAIDKSLYDQEKKQWLIEDDDSDQLRMPTSWELYEVFSDFLSVSEDRATGLVTVSVEYFSPFIAKNLVDRYVDAINSHMQSREVEKVTRNIEYLTNQIEKTSIAEMQEVLYILVEEQIKAKMVAEASPAYAFLTVSPSMVPEEKSRPKRAVLCILITLFGGTVACVWVLINYFRDV